MSQRSKTVTHLRLTISPFDKPYSSRVLFGKVFVAVDLNYITWHIQGNKYGIRLLPSDEWNDREIKLSLIFLGPLWPLFKTPWGCKPLLSPALFLYITHGPFCHIVSTALTFAKQSEVFSMKRIELHMDLTCNESGWLKNCHTEKLGQLNSIQPFKKWAEIRIKVKNLITAKQK